MKINFSGFPGSFRYFDCVWIVTPPVQGASVYVKGIKKAGVSGTIISLITTVLKIYLTKVLS